jgi:hypothetical protein
MVCSMGVQFNQGEIMKAFRHFNMERKRKGGNIYAGMGRDGQYRTCKLDFHSNGTPVSKGVADKIAEDLKFKDSKELRDCIDGM